MSWYSKIKAWYPDRWGKSRVRDACDKGYITPEEYEDIVGEPYVGASHVDFTGMTAAEVARSLSYRPTLDELRQACDWLGLAYYESMTRAQLRALIDAAVEAEGA